MTEEDFAAQVDAELANLVSGGFTELSTAELTELLNRMSERAVRRALESAIWRLRGLKETMRVTAERDGWRAIAATLLGVVGLPIGDLPPVEIIELRETSKLPPKNIAALEQFWADLTKKHQQRQASQRVRFPGHDERTEEILVGVFDALQRGAARVENLERRVEDYGVETVIAVREPQPRTRRRR